MTIKIHLQNKKKYFNILVLNNENNKIIDKIGIYNINSNYIILNGYKLRYWISIGAILSNRLINLLKKTKNLPH